MKALKEIGGSALIVFSMVGSLFCIHEVATANAKPTAQASQAFCTNMDIVSNRDGEPEDVTTQDITDVLHDMQMQGISTEYGAEIVADALRNRCPEWSDVIIDYFNQLNHTFTVTDDWRVVWKSVGA